MRVDREILNGLLLVIVTLAVASCSFSNRQSGGYYQDDGPGKRRVDISKIPNAVPRYEVINQATSRPYKIRGKRYVPLRSSQGYRKEGFASWYGKKYHGRKTSSGEVYDMYAMTAAHTTLPIPSYVRVTNLSNQRSVVVRVNDRGPFIDNRVIDLSYVAAQKLGVVASGTGRVLVESVSSDNSSLNSSSTLTSRSYINQRANQKIKQNPYSQTQSRSAQVAQKTAKPQLSSLQTQWFQVGAFSVLNNAENLKSRLSHQGFTPQVIRATNLYKVVVGPINSSESVSIKQRLQSYGYPVNNFKE